VRNTEHRINNSATAFSLNALNEWLQACQDRLYDPEWLEALATFSRDLDMVLVLSGQPLDQALSYAGSVTTSDTMIAAGLVRRYLNQLGRLTGEDVPYIKVHLDGDDLWIYHNTYAASEARMRGNHTNVIMGDE